MTRRLLTALLACLVAVPTACQGRAPGPSPVALPIGLTRVSPRVLVLECLDVNVTAIATSRGIVVVDTGRSPSLMEQIVLRIGQEFGRRDVCCVINTHAHPDHCGGNQVFPDTLIVGHENAPRFLAHSRPDLPGRLWRLEDLLDRARQQMASPDTGAQERHRLRAEIRARELLLRDLRSRYVPTAPTRTFDDRLSLDLGDVGLELLSCGRAHTDNDILIYVPEEQVLLTGDLFCSASSPCFPVNPLVDVPRLSARVARVLGDPAGLETVIPGHGRPFGRDALVGLLEQLRERDAAFDGRRSAAATLDTMIARLGLEEALDGLAAPAKEEPGPVYYAEDEFGLLARTYRWRGMASVAVAVLTKALSFFPESALLLDGLGAAHLENGDVASAIASYERSLALEPANRNAAEMLEALRGR